LIHYNCLYYNLCVKKVIYRGSVMVDDDLPPALRRGPKMLQKNLNSPYGSTKPATTKQKPSPAESRTTPDTASSVKDNSVHLTPAQIAQKMMEEEAAKGRGGSYENTGGQGDSEHHPKPAEIAQKMMEEKEATVSKSGSGDDTIARGVSTPPLRENAQNNTVSNAANNFRDFDYVVHNHDTQFVEIILKPSRELIYQKDTIMTFDNGIEFATEVSSHKMAPQGLIGKMVSTGMAMASHSKVIVKKCKNTSFKPKHVLFSGNFPGNIAVINLGQYRSILCRENTLLCASASVIFTKADSKENGECKKVDGLKLLKLEGDGLVFLWFGGGVYKRTLAQGETINAFQTYVMARQSTVNITLSTLIESGFAKIIESYTGPGDIWIQSNSLGNFKDKIVSSTMLAAKNLVASEKKKDKKK